MSSTRDPSEKGGRRGPQIDDDVVDGAARTAHELSFGLGGRLVVQTAQGATPRVERDAGLDEPGWQPGGRELFLAERPREEPPIVDVPLDIDDHGVGKLGGREAHQNTVSSGIGTTKRPPHSRTADICCVISSRRFHGRMNT